MTALGFDQLEERLTAKLAMFVFRANARGPDPTASFPRQVCVLRSLKIDASMLTEGKNSLF